MRDRLTTIVSALIVLVLYALPAITEYLGWAR